MKRSILFISLLISMSSLISCGVKKYQVDFKNYNGTLLYTTEVEEGKIPVYEGEIPTKDNNEEVEYFEFVGWDNELTETYSDMTYTAVFIEHKRQFTIEFYNYDETLLYSEIFEYGEQIVYNGPNPYRPGNDEIERFEFMGWNKQLGKAYMNERYIAVYEPHIRKFLIEFCNYDNTVLYSDYFEYGDEIVYNGPIPTRATVNHVGYIFTGWDKPLGLAYSNERYMAIFEEIHGVFTITFKDGNEIIHMVTVKSGGKCPEFVPEEKDNYDFMGWYSSRAVHNESTKFNFDSLIFEDKVLYSWYREKFAKSTNVYYIIGNMKYDGYGTSGEDALFPYSPGSYWDGGCGAPVPEERKMVLNEDEIANNLNVFEFTLEFINIGERIRIIKSTDGIYSDGWTDSFGYNIVSEVLDANENKCIISDVIEDAGSGDIKFNISAKIKIAYIENSTYSDYGEIKIKILNLL